MNRRPIRLAMPYKNINHFLNIGRNNNGSEHLQKISTVDNDLFNYVETEDEENNIRMSTYHNLNDMMINDKEQTNCFMSTNIKSWFEKLTQIDRESRSLGTAYLRQEESFIPKAKNLYTPDYNQYDCSSAYYNSTLFDNKYHTDKKKNLTNIGTFEEGSFEDVMPIAEDREDTYRKIRKNIMNEIQGVTKESSMGVIKQAEFSIIRFIKNSVLNKFIYAYKARYINESIHCACLPSGDEEVEKNSKNIHFIHSTNYLFHIVFNKRIKLRTIGNIPIREGLEQGVYFRQLDPLTFAIGFIYESIETVRDENLNEIHTPVLYNNIYVIGKNANSFIERFTQEFIKVEAECTGRMSKMRNIAATKADENQTFKSIYINGNPVKCKSFSDIIMDENDKDKLKEKIKSFILNKNLYYDHNIKYKLGIILYGEPGTGKTTMIHSIASYISELTYELDKYRSVDIEEVHSIKSDRGYNSGEDRGGVNNRRNHNYMNPPTGKNGEYKIKIVEEFDTYFEDSTSDDANGFKVNKGATKKDVVSFIDNCEDGTIFILSTNHIDRIREFDSALIRPGRIDMFIEMKPFEKEQAIEFANWFNLEDKSFLEELEYPIMPSELEVMIQGKLYEQIDNKLYDKK